MSDTQRLPNLYQLLGLGGLETNREKIVAALKKAQAKAAALQADASRAADVARLQKVIALGQKYLLSPALKSSYDSQWTATYGAAEQSQATTTASPAMSLSSESARSTATVQPVVTTVAPRNDPVVRAANAQRASAELVWDMASLDALLPPADPHAPFQMAEYLRTSQVRDPMAAEADLRKLISLLGGEDLANNEPAPNQSIGLTEMANELRMSEVGRSNIATEEPALVVPRSTNNTAAVGLAKRMRRKRQQAMLFGGTMLAAAVGGLVLLGFYLNQPKPKPTEPLAQANQPSSRTAVPVDTALNQPDNNQATVAANAAQPAATNSFGLPQPGENVTPMEIQAKPDATASMPDKTAMEPMKPDAPKPDAPKPEPTNPEPAKPEPAKPEPAKPEPTTPEPKPEVPAADVKLNAREKKAWQDEMRRARAALNKLDPAATEKQIADLKELAKTAAQQSQLASLEQIAVLMKKAREAIVAGIGGLESAQTFTVGTSTEVAFIEGDDTRIIVRAAGSRQEHKIESMPFGMGIALMKLKPNVVDANLDAAMGAYILAQPKKSANATAQGKKLLEEAASAGAIPKDLPQFFEEDFKL